MANTYTQIYIHYVFATKLRIRAFNESRRTELFDYTAGLIAKLGCFVHRIGGAEDHIHILLGLHPTLSVSECAQKIKANTSRFINEQGWMPGKFTWQEGFGAFSVSHSNLEMVRAYIGNQVQHHTKQTFVEEFEALLSKHLVDYNRKFMFKELD
jgi:REP element-mobilizing transposase RayT